MYSLTKNDGYRARLFPTNDSQFARGFEVGLINQNMRMEEMENLQFRMCLDPNTVAIPRYPAALEERFLTQKKDYEALIADNQRLATIDVALKLEIADAQKDLQLMAHQAETLKTEKDVKDVQLSTLYEKYVKLKNDLGETEIMKTQLGNLNYVIKQLTDENYELTSKVQMMSNDLSRMLKGVQEVQALNAEIESMKEEIHCGRDVIEYERTVDAENYEHWKEMDQDLACISQEIEELHMEIDNAEKRARAMAVASAVCNYGNTGYEKNVVNDEVQHTGNSLPLGYEGISDI